MRVLFVAGFGPITPDVDRSRDFYKDVLGLPLSEDADGYMYADRIEGARHFAVWPLAQAATSCFGSDRWPADLPAPTSWLEFDVDDIEAATRELEGAGCALLTSVQKEPWGQTVTRMLSPEGTLLALTHTPSMRDASA